MKRFLGEDPSALWEILASNAFTADVLFIYIFPLPDAADRRSNKSNFLGVFTRRAAPHPCARQREGRRHCCRISLSFSSIDSRKSSFTWRRLHGPHILVMRGAAPPPLPIPDIIYFHKISRMFNFISKHTQITSHE